MCLSVCIYHLGLHWTDFHEILLKCRKNPNLRKIIEKRIRHFTWRPRYICTVDSNMKYFLAQQQCRGNQLLCFQGHTQQLYIVSSGMWLSNKRKTHCCIFKATLSVFLYPVTCSSTIHNMLCAHGNSYYLNVPQHYIIHTLPILLEILIFSPGSEPTVSGPEFKDIWIVWGQMTFLGLLS